MSGMCCMQRAPTWREMMLPLHVCELLRKVFQQPLLRSALPHERRHLLPQVPDDEHVDARRSDSLHELVHLHTTIPWLLCVGRRVLSG